MAKRTAVVIGINYTHFPPNTAGEVTTRAGTIALAYAEADAQDMTAALQQSGYHVVTLLGVGATRRAIIEALHGQIHNTDPDGLLLVHFSGHGQVDPEDPHAAYLLPVDADPQNPGVDGILLENLASTLLGRVNNALTLLDCCHSGYAAGVRAAAVPDDLALEFRRIARQSFQAAGRVALTACAGSQLARELTRLQHGAFTYYALDWWRKSHDTDDYSLASYITAALRKEGLPEPARGGSQQGSLLLRDPPPPAPPPPPDVAWRDGMANKLAALQETRLRRVSFNLGYDYDQLSGPDRDAKTLTLVCLCDEAAHQADLARATAAARDEQTRAAQLAQVILTRLDADRRPALWEALRLEPPTPAEAQSAAGIHALIARAEATHQYATLEAAARAALAPQAPAAPAHAGANNPTVPAREPTAGARIVVRRESQWAGGGNPLKILLDGQIVGTVANGGTLVCPVTPGPHEVRLEPTLGSGILVFSSKVLILNANPGQEIALTCRWLPWWPAPELREA